MKIRKNYLGLLLILGLGWSKISGQSVHPSISGQIIGHHTESFLIVNDSNSFEVMLDSAGNYTKVFSDEKLGLYTMLFGSEKKLPIYIDANTELHLNLDLNKLKNAEPNPINFSGKGIEATTLLIEVELDKPGSKYTRVNYKDEYIPLVHKKNPQEFETYWLESLDKTTKIIEEHKKKHPNIPSSLIETIKLNNLLSLNGRFRLYENYRTYFFPNDPVEIPEKFKDYFASKIPQNNIELYQTNIAYKSYLGEKYYAQMNEALKGYPRESLAYYKAEITYLKDADIPDVVKNNMYGGLTVGYMRTKDPEIKTYLNEMVNTYVTDAASLQRFEDYKKKETGYVDGDMAPNFTYPDINGKQVSLSDFKGSVVYIDLWATWCGPCIAELPYFQKLKKKYKGQNITFLSVSFDESVDSWKKMVKENKDGLFSGLQLVTGVYANDIGTNFNVNGIPHYILIDTDGNIVQKNAIRPSDPKIEETLYNLLK